MTSRSHRSRLNCRHRVTVDDPLPLLFSIHFDETSVEFRHRSWWNESAYKAFRDHGTIFCSCSAPRLPDELIQTFDDIYVRFHGTTRMYRHDYSTEELTTWSQRILNSGADRSWIYFNNDRDAYPIKNAKQLAQVIDPA